MLSALKITVYVNNNLLISRKLSLFRSLLLFLQKVKEKTEHQKSEKNAALNEGLGLSQGEIEPNDGTYLNEHPEEIPKIKHFNYHKNDLDLSA
jgi:hypothetical protein